MSRRHSLLAVALGALALPSFGCGEAAFSAHARDNVAEDIRRAVGSAQPTPQPARNRGYLVTTDRQLVAFDLTAGRAVWQEPADVRSRVIAGRDLVVHRSGKDQLVARDAETGKVRFTIRIAAGERFVGLALDDERLYYVVQASGGAQRISTVVAVDARGGVLWRAPAPGTLGAPAAVAGVVAVPFRYQNLVLLDGHTGKELARVRNKDEQITFVRGTPWGFFYGGGKGVYLLDEKSATGKRASSSYLEANLGSEQIRSSYHWDGYQPAQADYTAFDRNRLLWRGIVRRGEPAFQDDVAYLHSYRYFFAFDARSGKLRWVHAHPRVDVISADDLGPTIAYASADGDVAVLDSRTGAVRSTVKTGLRLLGATFDADNFAGGRDATIAASDVLRALHQIIWDPDARFTAVKVFAVDALGALPGREATAELVRVVRAEKGLPAAVQKKAGEELIARKDPDAAPLLLEGLQVRHDFSEDRRPQGADVLAQAAAALGLKEAAPGIATQLLDPATPTRALKPLAGALAELGTPDALRALRTFLLLYRSDGGFANDPAALERAASGLLEKGGSDGLRTVSFVAAEDRTLRPLQAALRKLLADPAKAAASTSAPSVR